MPAAPTSRAPSWITRAAAPAALVVLVALAFGGARANGWILFDDPAYVRNYPPVLGGLSWAGLRAVLGGIHGGNWHPLTSLSHMLDVELFGLEAAGPHTVNVALHAANAVLCYLTLGRLTRAQGASFAAALLFALHPLRVESVAWISERKDVLSGVCFWLTLLAWIAWTERPSARRYLGVVACFAAGLASKPMLVTLPFLLLVLDAWPLARVDVRDDVRDGFLAGWWPRVREKLPLFALSAAASVVTFFVQQAAGAMQAAAPVSLAQRLGNAPVSVVRYVELTFWPAKLYPYYPYELRVSQVVPLACLAAVALATWLALRQRAARPWLAVGWLWFLGLLVPVIGIVQVGGQAFADRYTYLPAVGLAWIVAFAGREAIARVPALRGPILAALAIVTLAMVLATRAQVARWQSTLTLFAHTLRHSDSALAHSMYGNALFEAGELEEARTHQQAALKLAPDLRAPHEVLGAIYEREGRFEEAIAEHRAANAIRPTADSWFNVGVCLLRLGRPDESIPPMENALRIDPEHQPTLERLGITLVQWGQFARGALLLETAVARDPADAETLRFLGLARRGLGDKPRGFALLERAFELAPGDVWTALDLADAHATEGRFPAAAELAARAKQNALAAGDGRLAGIAEQRLAAYRAGRRP